MLLLAGNHHSGYGYTAGQSVATNTTEFFRQIRLNATGTSVTVFGGVTGGSSGGYFQLWEYEGPEGGPNEIRAVAFPPFGNAGVINISGTQQAVTIEPDIRSADPFKIVPVLSGALGGGTQNIDRVHVELIWNPNTRKLTAQRAVNPGVAQAGLNVGFQLIEFRGSSWTVSGPHTANFIGPGSVSVPIPAVESWDRAFILSTSRNRSNNRAANYTLRPDTSRLDRVLAFCPDGPQVIDGIGLFGGDRATFYVVRNPNIGVSHLTSHNPGQPGTISGAGTPGVLQNEDYDLGDLNASVSDLGSTAVVATVAAFGNEDGYDSPRGHFGYRLYEPSGGPTLQFTRGFQGNDTPAQWAAQIIRFTPPLENAAEVVDVDDVLHSVSRKLVFLVDAIRAVDTAVLGFAVDLYGVPDVARAQDVLHAIKTDGPGDPGDPGVSTMPVIRANWSVTVTIETQWQTTVDRSAVTGVEERRALLTRPRRIFRLLFTGMDKDESAELRRALTEATQGAFNLPVYSDVMILDALATGGSLPVEASQRRVANGSRVVAHGWTDRRRPGVGQIRTVSSVLPASLSLTETLADDIPARGRVYPLARCRAAIEQPFVAEAEGVIQVQFEAVEDDGPGMLPARPVPATIQAYDGRPILRWRPNWFERPTMVAGRIVEQQPYGRAIFDRFLSSGTRVDHTVLFNPSGRVEAWELLGFLESLRGRLSPFWIQGPQSLGTVVSVQPSSALLQLTVTTSGLVEALAHIAFELIDGNLVIVPVNEVTVRTGGQVLVLFDGDLASGFQPEQVRRVTTAHLVRLQDDVLLEEWTTTDHCRVQISVRDVLAEPRDVQFAGFQEASYSGVTAIEGVADFLAIFDASKNALFGTTAVNLDINSSLNGTIKDADLWPGLDSAVQYFADSRYVIGQTYAESDDRYYFAPRLNQLTAGNTRRIRPHAPSVGTAEALVSVAGGLPTLTRVGSASNSVLLFRASDAAIADRWYADGFTVFLHINTPVYSGAQAYRLWREGISVDTVEQEVLFFGQDRMGILPTAGSGASVPYPSIYDGRSKLVVWRWRPSDGFHTAWVDGEFLAQQSAPGSLPSTAAASQRWFEWFATAKSGAPLNPTKQPGQHLQVNGVALFARGLDIEEVDTVGEIMAARYNTPWTEPSL